ncbi:MAG TPA: DUF1707 domain-containing protein [Actinomycetes bacterium]|jgi:hypothetical protein|nr:DUF1707 domain-containing protein [Actinomycetes bacterium]
MSAELLPAGSYRVGDAERSRTTELLKEAHVAGYLTLAEIDERLSAALAARTRDELERLVADLPPDWRARQAGAPAAAPRRTVPPVAWWLLPLALLVVAMVVLAIATRGFFFPWPLLWLWLAFGRRHGRAGWHPPRSHRGTWV